MHECTKVKPIWICAISTMVTIIFVIMIILTLAKNQVAKLNSQGDPTEQDRIMDSTTKPPCYSNQTCISYTESSDIFGLLTQAAMDIRSPKLCQRECKLDPDCVFFTWTSASQVCVLEVKNCADWMDEDKGKITGPKYCD